MTTRQAVYIAGPMTGRPRYNYDAFNAARARLQRDGYLVVTPFECTNKVWFREHGRDFDLDADRCEYGDPLMATIFAEDVASLCAANVVVLLDGWEASKGATLEALIAYQLGKTLLDERGKPVDLSVSFCRVSRSKAA